MINKELNAYVCIISHKRPQNVQKMHEHCGEDVTWYVHEGEGAAYQVAGAKNIVECKGLMSENRNIAMEHAFVYNVPCIMLDDDLNYIKGVSWAEDQKPFRINMSFIGACQYMMKWLDKHEEYKFAGIPPTSNLQNFKIDSVFSTQTFIISNWLIIKPSTPRFDKRLLIKADYDFSLQHIKQYGGLVRFNDIIPDFDHFKQKGGCVSEQRVRMEQGDIILLKKMWGTDVIKDSKRKDNHITIRPKKMLQYGIERNDCPEVTREDIEKMLDEEKRDQETLEEIIKNTEASCDFGAQPTSGIENKKQATQDVVTKEDKTVHKKIIIEIDIKVKVE